MPYLVTYRKNNEQHQLEWIVPSNFSEAAIREAFERQYSGAEIISIAACGECCLAG